MFWNILAINEICYSKLSKRVLKANGIFLIGVPETKGFKTATDHKTYYEHHLLRESFNKHYNFYRSFYSPF